MNWLNSSENREIKKNALKNISDFLKINIGYKVLEGRLFDIIYRDMDILYRVFNFYLNSNLSDKKNSNTIPVK